MSKVVPKSGTRRITANWTFESSRLPFTSPAEKKLTTRQHSREIMMTDARYTRAEVGRGLGPKTPTSQMKSTSDKDVSVSRKSGSYMPLPGSVPPNKADEEPGLSNDNTSDGTDSGLGSATMLSVNQEILEYMADHLMHFMNPTLVLPHLMNYDLLTKDDAAYISSPQRTDEERKEKILCALAIQDADVTERLVECLAGDSAYSNHRYMARKLREAIERKKQHPELPLSTLRLETPPHDSREPSPPSAPIKPRGAAQRNSIAKLLATKRNNVANLISRIETKEVSQQQQVPRQNNRSEQVHGKPRMSESSTQYQKDVQYELQAHRHHFHDCSASVFPVSHYNKSAEPIKVRAFPATTAESQVPHSLHHDDLSHSRPSPLPLSPQSRCFSPTQPSPLPLSPQSRCFSPTQTHLADLRETDPSLSHSHAVTTPKSPNPPPTHSAFVLPHSPHDPSAPTSTKHVPVTTHAQEQFCPPTSSPAPLAPIHSSHPNSPPILSPKRRSENRAYETRSYLVNEKVPQQNRATPLSPTTQYSANHRRECLVEDGSGPQLRSYPESESDSQRSSLPDLLSSASPKRSYPQSPTYTDKCINEAIPSEEYSPNDENADYVIPVRHRQRATRVAGLTARFYKNRRSASMSGYDSRPFKRGEHIYASDSRGRMERSAFHHHSHESHDTSTDRVRASVREGTEKLVKRRIDWLQERVQFTECPEHIQFTSRTHYGEERELLYSGTLNKHGKPRFVVLFTDYLLVLKARRPSVPSKLGGVFSFQQSSRIDWFSDLEYTAKKPMPLHLLTVQHQSSKQSTDKVCLHFNEKNKVIEIVLQAVSKEARDIWVEELSEAITQATSAHADIFLLIGNKALLKKSGEPYKRLQLQIHSASSLGLAANCNSFSLFCVIELGKQRCRTPSVMGGYNPSWEYKCEFTDFDDDDNLLIEVFSENIFRPNDFLGYLNVSLASLPEEQSGRKKFDGNMVLAGLEEAFAGELHISVEQGWETKM